MDQRNPTITLMTSAYEASQIAEHVCKLAAVKIRVRMVDVRAQSYQMARQYVIRLLDEVINDPVVFGHCTAVAGLSREACHTRFQPVELNSVATQSKGCAT
jgi:hypothetical protein